MQNAVTPGLPQIGLAPSTAGATHSAPQGDTSAGATPRWGDFFEASGAEIGKEVFQTLESVPSGGSEPDGAPPTFVEGSSDETSDLAQPAAAPEAPENLAIGLGVTSGMKPERQDVAAEVSNKPAPVSLDEAGDAALGERDTGGERAKADAPSAPMRATAREATALSISLGLQRETPVEIKAEEVPTARGGSSPDTSVPTAPSGLARMPRARAGAEVPRSTLVAEVAGDGPMRPDRAQRDMRARSNTGEPSGPNPVVTNSLKRREIETPGEVQTAEIPRAEGGQGSRLPLFASGQSVPTTIVPVAEKTSPITEATAARSKGKGAEVLPAVERAIPRITMAVQRSDLPIPPTFSEAPSSLKGLEKSPRGFSSPELALETKASDRPDVPISGKNTLRQADWSSRISHITWSPLQTANTVLPGSEDMELASIVSGGLPGDPGDIRLSTPAGAATAPGLPGPGAQNTVQGIAQQIAHLSRPLPEGPVELHLRPEELGRLKLTFAGSDGGLIVTVVAERAETLDLLRRNVDLLAQDMRRMGQEGAQFSFHGGGDPEHSQERWRTEDRQLRGTGETRDDAVIRLDLADAARAAGPGLDLRL